MNDIRFGPVLGLQRSGDEVRVGGRVLAGPIRVGDRFTSVVIDGATVPIHDLGVTDIILYGSSIEEVDPVYTPTLVLRGEDIDRVVEGADLCGEMSPR
jgi:hypothetical protein